jgi:probable F420-dependent oxidoreductase
VKIRIGIGLGARTGVNDSAFGDVVDALEELGWDSLWLSERIGSPAPDPLIALSFAAGRTARLKLGTSVMVLPGRNPMILAKELATLDRLSGGRLLPAFGLGAVDPNEQQAFGVERAERARLFDESLAVVRAAWSQPRVTYHGRHFHLDEVEVEPKPLQHHVDVWLGGIAPSELRRVGRLADGWLPSFVTSDDVAAGRAVIEATASEHGRSIDPEHFGVLIPYVESGEPPQQLIAALASRRPDLDDARRLVACGWAELSALIDEFVAVGTSKFIVFPLGEPPSTSAWRTHLERAAEALLPKQT